MSTNNNKKSILKTMFTSNVGCGCGKLKLSDVHEPAPRSVKKDSSKSNISHIRNPNCSSSSSCEKNNEDCTSTTLSFHVDTTAQNSESETDHSNPSNMPSPCPKIIDSIAVVKDSSDPYQDFRHSMLQMIWEKEIFSKDDLQELLNCFLELNSPCHHNVIVQAFTEISNEIISKRLNSQKPSIHVDQLDDESS